MEYLMAENLGFLGWDSGWAEVFEGADAEGAWPARVTAQHRDRWVVQSSKGLHDAPVVGSGDAAIRPVTGDWVGCVAGPHESDSWSIVAVLPRRSGVRRGAAGESQGQQVLAANVDRLWIVQSLETPPNLRSLERYLAVAWESGAFPEIVLSKSDLAQDLEAGQTVALLGPSGAGKSTLVNHLADSELAWTAEVRSGDRKGRHTTTTRQLFPIHGGALLLDTPGMRELKTLDLDEGLGHAFPEIQELSAECRFRDCSHSSEPGCAVLAAAEEGRLDPNRLSSYRKLQAEAAYERRRVDPRARAEHVAEWKTAMRTMKHHHKYRPRD